MNGNFEHWQYHCEELCEEASKIVMLAQDDNEAC
jgi:hypothetical protein